MKPNKLNALFQEYLDYCRYYKRLRPATIMGYSNHFKVFSKVLPITSPATELTMQNIVEFFKRLEVRKRIIGKNQIVTGVKKSTIEAYWHKLNPFFEWLVTKGEIPSNPLRKLQKPKPEYTDKRKLSKKQVEKIITAICLYPSSSLVLKRDQVIFYILLFCGLRKGELLGLQVRDIDLQRRVLTVRGDVSKSKTTRQLPLNPTLIMHLEDYLCERKKRDYTTESLIVSSTHNCGLTDHGIKHWVKKISQRSGVKFHLHQFRHTFACNLGTQNVSAIKIQKLMGHTDLRMTQKYLRSMGVEDLRSEINKLTIDSLI